MFLPYVISAAVLALALAALSVWALGGRPRKPACARTRLSTREAERLFERIELFMERAKPFRDPSFGSAFVAQSLGVSESEVAEAVKLAAGKTLSEYVRAWRVREADRLLKDPANREASLEALAIEAGFHSRSEYYEAFETEFGVTPGERRRQVA